MTSSTKGGLTPSTKPASTVRVCEVLEDAFNCFAPSGCAEATTPIDRFVRDTLAEGRYAASFVPGLKGVAYVTYRRRSYYMYYNPMARRWVAKNR